MTQVSETTEGLTQTMREANQAVTKSLTEAQQRSMKYAQSVFESGAEVLRENTQDTIKLVQSLMEPPQEPQRPIQTLVNSAVAVQERNVKFAQGVVEKWIEVLSNQAESNQALVQTLVELSKKQQEAFQEFAQEPASGYFGFFTAPFSFYQRAVESFQEMAVPGAQKATHKAAPEKVPAAATK